MRRPRLFCPELNLGKVRLSRQETHHLHSSLRAKSGQEVVLFDGEGREGFGVLAGVNRREAEIDIWRVERRAFDVCPRLTLAVAMTRPHRQGYLIEKCTELGVAAIWPILTERSTDKPKASAVMRWKRRAVEAAKQSGRAWLPSFSAPQTFTDSLRRTCEFDAAAMAHARPTGSSIPQVGESVPYRPLSELLELRSSAQTLAVWVGPEGGWSDAEVQQAVASGASVTTLAPTVLRTETAAIAVSAIVAVHSARRIPRP